MSSNIKIVNILTVKLCLTSNATKKAEEFLRLLELKTSLSSALSISETCRAVICLSLAAATLGEYCDKTNAIKLSGVKKTVYLSNFHTVQKLLKLDEQLRVKDLCVRLNVEEACTLATRLLKSFLSEKPSADPSHPMYPTVAVFSASRHMRLKVDKNALVEMSCLKRPAFDTLTAEFGKVVGHMLPVANKMTKKRSHPLADVIQNCIKDSQKTFTAETEDDPEVGIEPAENFKDWKKRILLQNSSGDKIS